MDYIPPASSARGITPGESTAVGCPALLQGISQPRDGTQISCISGRFFTSEPPGKPAYNFWLHQIHIPWPSLRPRSPYHISGVHSRKETCLSLGNSGVFLSFPFFSLLGEKLNLFCFVSFLLPCFASLNILACVLYRLNLWVINIFTLLLNNSGTLEHFNFESPSPNYVILKLGFIAKKKKPIEHYCCFDLIQVILLTFMPIFLFPLFINPYCFFVPWGPFSL